MAEEFPLAHNQRVCATSSEQQIRTCGLLLLATLQYSILVFRLECHSRSANMSTCSIVMRAVCCVLLLAAAWGNAEELQELHKKSNPALCKDHIHGMKGGLQCPSFFKKQCPDDLSSDRSRATHVLDSCLCEQRLRTTSRATPGETVAETSWQTWPCNGLQSVIDKANTFIA